VLAVLEKTDRRPDGAAPALDDLPLFAAARPTSPAARPAGPDPLREAIAALNPDDLSPREALDALYRLKKLADGR
jgi:DNA mismatch repair protein MutS